MKILATQYGNCDFLKKEKKSWNQLKSVKNQALLDNYFVNSIYCKSFGKQFSLSRNICSIIKKKKKIVNRFHEIFLQIIFSLVWKNVKFTLTEFFPRQINSLVINFVNALISRNLWQKSVRAHFENCQWYLLSKK